MADYRIGFELEIEEHEALDQAVSIVRQGGDQGRLTAGPCAIRSDELEAEGQFLVELSTEDPPEHRARYAMPEVPAETPSQQPVVNLVISPDTDAAKVAELLAELKSKGVNLG